MKTEYISNEDIWRAADRFRESAELTEFNMPPIDVLYIVDVIMRFDVIDIADLFADLRMDAATSRPSREAGRHSTIQAGQRYDKWNQSGKRRLPARLARLWRASEGSRRDLYEPL